MTNNNALQLTTMITITIMNPSKQVVVTTPVEVQEKFCICQACDSTINIGESKKLRKMNVQWHK